MAPFIPVPLVAQCEVRFTLNGQRCENVLYFSYADSDFATCVTDVGANFVDTVLLPLLPNLSTQITFNELYFTDLDSVDGPVATYTTDLPLSGSNANDVTSNAASLVLCFRTNKRGRSFRGRNYLAGIARSSSANSQWNPTLVGDIVGLYNTFKDNAAEDGEPWVVVSRYADGEPRLVGIHTNIVRVDAVTPAHRTQRRRQPGIGG